VNHEEALSLYSAASSSSDFRLESLSATSQLEILEWADGASSTVMVIGTAVVGAVVNAAGTAGVGS
jgi:hypothetical protein